MNRSLRDNILFGCLLGILALIVTDCSSGHKRFCPGVVRQHVYSPPYTSTHTDKHGHVSSDYHPAKYHLIVACGQPQHVANVEVSLFTYGTTDDNQSVVVGERIGRWSNLIYFTWIAKMQPTTEGY